MSAPEPSLNDWRKGLPTISGTNVDVREITAADAPALFELLTDPLVTKHISPPPPSVSAFEGFIVWAQRERTLGNGVCFGIVPRGLEQAVGVVQVRALDPSFFVAEWGFALAAPFWATGVFQEAATLVATFAFQTLKVHRLEARAVSQNGRGHGALQKLGAVAEAVLAKSFKREGHYDEQLLWTLLATEWGAASAERADATAAKARIALAVTETQQALRISRAQTTHEAPVLYPFFVTDQRTKRICPVCGTETPDPTCPTCD
jgi:[ribosomal protein S5]-alanine N-acetyltransferase